MAHRLAPIARFGEGVGQYRTVGGGVGDVDRLPGGAQLALRIELPDRRRLHRPHLPALEQAGQDLHHDIAEEPAIGSR